MGKAHRTSAGYRICDENDVNTLRFVRRARDLGFSIKEISDLLALWQDTERATGDVKSTAERHIAQLDARIGELRMIRRTLQRLSDEFKSGVRSRGRCSKRS